MSWKEDIANGKRLIGFLKPYRPQFIAAVLMIILLALLGPFRPLVIMWIVQEFIVGEPGQLTAIQENFGAFDGNSAIMFWSLLVVTSLVIEGIIQYFQTYTANWIGQSIVRDLRNKLFKHITTFRLQYFDKTPIGTIVTRVVSDIEAISQVFSSGLIEIVGDLLKLLTVIILMFIVNWQFALISLVSVPLLIIATKIFAKAMKKAYQQERLQVNRLNTFVQEHIVGMNVVQIFNREKVEMDRFVEINKEHRQAHMNAVWAFSIFFPIVELLSSLSLALLIFWGVMQLDPDDAGSAKFLSQIFGYILWIQMLFRPIRQLAEKFNVLQRGVVRWERVFAILENDQVIQDSGTATTDGFKGNIAFKNVRFAYNEPEWVLKDLSFSVKPGETVAFVGSTGAGKSTIVNLITRYYEFQQGEILLDGHEIREYQLAFLRSRIAVVLQDVFLFSDSIHNNITLKNMEITREEVIEAAKVVGAHEFIMRLPGGYDYNVRERGGMLSVGQRQLIAFIRAYVYNPDILILDEATSSVDTESELLIQKAIERITQGRTSIVIAHRLSTIQNADKIIVIDKGEIVEQGSHQELLTLDGHYKVLYDLQFK